MKNREYEIEDNPLAKLDICVRDNYIDMVRTIIAEEKSKKGEWRWDESKENYVEKAMIRAVKEGRTKIVEIFLENGIDASLNLIDEKGRSSTDTILHLAVEENQEEIVKLLAEKRRRYNDDLLRFIVGRAFKQNPINLKILKILFENGASADSRVNVFHDPMYLGQAALKENIPLIELLLKYAASIETAINIHHSLRDESSIFKGYVEKQAYRDSIKLLLDFAQGVDLDHEHGTALKNLLFLNEMDISGFNFIGVSCEGKPITREWMIEKNKELQSKHKKGFTGIEHALVTLDDLENLPDTKRKKELKARLEEKFSKHGKLIEEGNIVNLVPLDIALEILDEKTAMTRLEYGCIPTYPSSILAAAKQEKTELVRALAKRFKEIPDNILVESIIILRKQEHFETANSLLKRIKKIDKVDKIGKTLLHHAVINGEVKQVERLIERRKADVNLYDGKSCTPLVYAVSKVSVEHLQITKFLLANDAKTQCMSNRYYPVEHAATNQNSEAVSLLLPHPEENEYGHHFFSIMLDPFIFPETDTGMQKWLNCLKLLKEKGIDLNKINYCGEGLLNNQVVYIHKVSDISKAIKKIGVLYDLGLDLNITCDKDKKTVLHELARKGFSKEDFTKYKELFEFLLSKNANINIADKDDRTPLHYAAKYYNSKAFTILLEFGADADIKDVNGHTALDLLEKDFQNKHKSSQDNVRKSYQAIKELVTKPKEKSFVESVDNKPSIKPEDILKQRESREQEFDLTP
jgi:ankyrin repeat protein